VRIRSVSNVVSCNGYSFATVEVRRWPCWHKEEIFMAPRERLWRDSETGSYFGGEWFNDITQASALVNMLISKGNCK